MKWIVSLWYSEELQHSHILILDNLEDFFLEFSSPKL